MGEQMSREDELYEAFLKSIRNVGLEGLKSASMFMANVDSEVAVSSLQRKKAA